MPYSKRGFIEISGATKQKFKDFKYSHGQGHTYDSLLNALIDFYLKQLWLSQQAKQQAEQESTDNPFTIEDQQREEEEFERAQDLERQYQEYKRNQDSQYHNDQQQ